MEWLITNVVAALFMPPGILLVLLLIAAYLTWRRPPLARGLVLFTFVALYALSTSFVADYLVRLIEPEPRDPLADRTGQAIVVLGGGIYSHAPEYGGDTINAAALARARYTALLHRALKKPILASAGAPEGNAASEAQLMKEVLQREFHVPVAWIEEASRNTLESGRASYRILDAAGIRRVYLVTHAWHMQRSRLAFEAAGFEVIPAPTSYATRFRTTGIHFVPRAQALLESSHFFHEAIGLGWYHLRIAIGR
jgi:uncharacterized SAM-binding protein YcdF (DUF218 family)